MIDKFSLEQLINADIQNEKDRGKTMKLLFEGWRKYLDEKVFADYSDGKKNKWIDLPTDELTNDPDNVDITDEIYDMIDKSYAKIGGNVDIRSASDMPSDYDRWTAVDVDADPEPDAVRGAKTKPAGIKMTVGASDGGPEGIKAYKEKTAELLNTEGNYGELSDAIAHVMIKYHNVPFVDNEEDVRKVLGKEIEWIGPHPEGKYPNHPGWYCRTLGKCETKKMKILLGRPKGVNVVQP